jgi:hypothetical protein
MEVGMSDSAERSEALGYQFLDRMKTSFEAYGRLAVQIEAQPTKRHFDPETMELSVRSERASGADHAMENIEVYHPWPGEAEYQVVLGRIYVKDRLGKTVEAFCFGGALAIEESINVTSCQISSEAPILNLTESDPMLDLLVSEVEVVLAEDRVKVQAATDKIQNAIVQAEPLSMYAACLLTLEQRLKAFAHKELPNYQHLRQLVKGEISRLKQGDAWPEADQDLDGLLLD